MQPSSPSSTPDPDHDASVAELERRIETLESLDDSELGEFTRGDWIVCILGALVIPTFAVIWFAR